MLEAVGSHNICLARHFRTSSFCVIFIFACMVVYFVLSLYLQLRRSVENNTSDSAYESTTGNASGVEDNTEHSTGKIYFNSCCWSSGINLIWVPVIAHQRKGISNNWGRKDWSKICLYQTLQTNHHNYDNKGSKWLSRKSWVSSYTTLIVTNWNLIWKWSSQLWTLLK